MTTSVWLLTPNGVHPAATILRHGGSVWQALPGTLIIILAVCVVLAGAIWARRLARAESGGGWSTGGIRRSAAIMLAAGALTGLFTAVVIDLAIHAGCPATRAAAQAFANGSGRLDVAHARRPGSKCAG